MTLIKPLALAMTLSGKVLLSILMITALAVSLLGLVLRREKRLDFLIASIAALLLTGTSLFLTFDELVLQFNLMFPDPRVITTWDNAYLFLANGILLLLVVPFGLSIGEGICLAAARYFLTGDLKKGFKAFSRVSEESYLGFIRVLRKVRALGM